MRILSQRGSSLTETLIALLLFSLSFSALIRYHQALADGFQRQWQQRSVWRQARQQLEGNEQVGWSAQLNQQSGPAGCQLLTARVQASTGATAQLTELRCAQ